MDWSAAAENTPVDLTVDREDHHDTFYHPAMPTGLTDEEVNQVNSLGSQHVAGSSIVETSEVIVEAITTFCNESTTSLRDVSTRLGAAKNTIKRQDL